MENLEEPEDYSIKVSQVLLKKGFFMSYRLSIVMLGTKSRFESLFENLEDPKEYSITVKSHKGYSKRVFLCRIDYQL